MGLITGRQKGDTMDDLGVESELGDFLALWNSAQKSCEELAFNHSPETEENMLRLWSLWHHDILSKYPVGLYSGGLAIYPGPSTYRESVTQMYLRQVQDRKVHAPFMGDPSNLVMGGFWKPFATFLPEFVTEREVEKALWKAKHRSPYVKNRVPEPKKELDTEILRWGSTWGELHLRGGGSGSFCSKLW
jgi:hypothetical protein